MRVRRYTLRSDASGPLAPSAELRDPVDLPPPPEAAEPWVAADAPSADRPIYTVSEIAQRIQALFAEGFEYEVWVEGELSDPKPYASGHLWFDLKDESAVLKSVMWREFARRLRFKPEQGLQVICAGRIEFYPRRGDVKFSVRAMEPKGMGALQLAFEQLKGKLQKDGLFAEERKRPLPAFTERVGVVTSPQGAAIDDILRVFNERKDDAHRVSILLYPTRVQGEGAAESIARAIQELNRLDGLDLILVGRGGGSIEDLWAFNEEVLARAISSSRLPVISAVGHEKDVTISDLVADVRAATPTKGAEIILARRRAALDRLDAVLAEPDFVEPERWLEEIREELEDLEAGLVEGLEEPVLSAAHRLQLLQSQLLSCSPQAFLLHQAGELHSLGTRLQSRMLHVLDQHSARVDALAGRLNALSPLAVLGRGYSITFNAGGDILRSDAQVRPGEPIETRLHRGRITSRVE